MMLMFRRIAELGTLTWLKQTEYYEADSCAHKLWQCGVHVHDTKILAAALAGGLLF